jgi:hypothetical protein
MLRCCALPGARHAQVAAVVKFLAVMIGIAVTALLALVLVRAARGNFKRANLLHYVEFSVGFALWGMELLQELLQVRGARSAERGRPATVRAPPPRAPLGFLLALGLQGCEGEPWGRQALM